MNVELRWLVRETDGDMYTLNRVLQYRTMDEEPQFYSNEYGLGGEWVRRWSPWADVPVVHEAALKTEEGTAP